ncbi:MAG: methyltransferase domain-containing protein [Planctomycetes bacterium]|nr:methyltransferase domain-containing protein [Planctomycetota bacterium]
MRFILILILLGSCAAPNSDLNKVFLKADDATIEKFVERFEGESREISSARDQIINALGLSEGMAVADIGAGTGLFEPLIHNAVGENGIVYAIDIAPKMVDYLKKRVNDENLSTVEVIQCTATQTFLAKESCDLVFICDTYHHFEYPAASLADIKRSLKPGGRLAIVDFHRIEGESRDWILSHVRCGQSTVIKEVLDAGFTLMESPKIDGLKENYLLIFQN